MDFEAEQQLVAELKKYVTENLPLSKMGDEELEEKIEEVVIQGVAAIPDYAFEGCTNLKSVTFEGKTEPNCSDSNTFSSSVEGIIVTVISDYQGSKFCGKTISRSQPLKKCGELTQEINQNKTACNCVSNANFTDANQTICKCDDGFENVNNTCVKLKKCGSLTKEVNQTKINCSCVSNANFTDANQTICQCNNGFDKVEKEQAVGFT